MVAPKEHRKDYNERFEEMGCLFAYRDIKEKLWLVLEPAWKRQGKRLTKVAVARIVRGLVDPEHFFDELCQVLAPELVPSGDDLCNINDAIPKALARLGGEDWLVKMGKADSKAFIGLLRGAITQKSDVNVVRERREDDKNIQQLKKLRLLTEGTEEAG